MDKKKEEVLQKIDDQSYMPFYGNLTKLNTERTILDLVGKDTLEALCSDIMYLLDTSVAVYEKNGDYAFGLFVSGWCQLMDIASRNLCSTNNNKEALTCGKWLCHENCWHDSAKVALKTGKPTDIDCIGGIKLYAEPIYASNQPIGVINIGYGNPPTDEKTLKELSEKYQVPYKELLTQAKSYKPSPPFTIDIAKKCLHNIAFLIGKIVESAQNERKLRESEKQFKTITENSADAIFITDQKGNYVYVNQAVSDLLGYSREKITRMNIQDISSPEEVSLNVQDFQCLLQGEKLFKELNLVKKDGSIIPVDLHAILLPNGFVYGSCRDITQRKQIERELHQSKDRLQKMLSLVPDMISIQDLDMNIVYSNWNGFAAVPEEKRVLNTKCYRTYRGLDDICPDCRAKAVFKTKKAFREEIKLPEGNWVDIRIIPILDRDGSVMLFVEWVRDITERKQAENRIKQLNSLLKSIRNVNQLIIQEDDFNKVIQDSCRILQQTREYLNIEIALLDEKSGRIKPVAKEGERKLKRWAAEVDNPAEAPRCIKEVIQSRKPNIINASKKYCGNCPYLTTDLPYMNIFVPMIIKGHLIGIITTTVRAKYEITQEEIDLLKEVAADLAFARNSFLAEEKMLTHIHLLQIAGKTAKFGGWSVDLATQTCLWSDTVADIHEMPHGYAPHVKEGIKFYAPEWQERITEVFSKCAHQGIPYNEETEIITGKGKRKWVRTTGRAVKNKKGEIVQIVGSFQDITKTKQTNEKIRQSQELLRKTIDTTDSCIFVKDYDGHYLMANKFMAELHHTTPGKMIGKTDMDFTQKEITTPEEAEQFLKDDREVIDQKKLKVISEEPFTMPDGSIRWFYTHKVPISLENDPRCILGVAIDITEQKQSRQKLQKSMNATIETISKISETRDPYTAGHQYRVYQLSVAIARELRLSRERIEAVRIASLIHDIGKMAVPSEILTKPGKLSEIEFGLIKEHPQTGYKILKEITFPYPIARIVLQHHERINGSGYPNQLKADEISLEARIIGVADVVEAMNSHRPYRAALGIDTALEEISKNRGTLYDPEVVDVCVKLFKEKGFEFE
jgi:PAS domain S-box-containing protein/putative nucleotidyltransferase with HDIG domain